MPPPQIPIARYAANQLYPKGQEQKEADEHLSACVAASVCVLVFFIIALLVSYISSGYQVSAAFLKATQTAPKRASFRSTDAPRD